MLQQLQRRSLWVVMKKKLTKVHHSPNLAQPDIEDIRSQAKAYYSDPTNSALYFMPPKVCCTEVLFYAADGGLASLRPGYRFGNIVQKAGQMMESWCG